jgi:GTPase SAR1 family protein
VPPPAASDPASLVEAARKLVDDSGSPTLLREWRRLWARVNEPHFSVAVVGETSRGKSTLVNRLLGAEVVPVGPLPTTAVLTRVLYAPEPSLSGIRPDGTRETLKAAPETWQNVLSGDAEPVWSALQCGVPHEWLRDTGLQLFDTPGAGDLSAERIEEVIDTIAVCDATLITISATMALSLTERAFIEQHILARNVPRILAVLTHLDEVRAEDRPAVVKHVRERLAALSPDVVLASAHAEPALPTGSGIEIAGPEAIAATLTAWAKDPQHRERVCRQLTANLRQFLTLVEGNLAARQAAAGLAEEQRQSEIEAEGQRIERLRLDWEDLRLAMRTRCASTLTWMDDQLTAAVKAVNERLDYELHRAPDPGLWWRQELPFRLRQELVAIARTMGDLLQRRVAADAVWLRKEAETRFGRQVETTGIDPFEDFVERSPQAGGARETADLNTLRWVTRFGTGAATVLGYVLYGPLGIAASVGAGLLGEYLLNRQAATQRDELARALPTLVERAVATGKGMAWERLQQAYDSLVNATIRHEEAWSAAWQETLERMKPAEAGDRESLSLVSAELLRFKTLMNKGEES